MSAVNPAAILWSCCVIVVITLCNCCDCVIDNLFLSFLFFSFLSFYFLRFFLIPPSLPLLFSPLLPFPFLSLSPPSPSPFLSLLQSLPPSKADNYAPMESILKIKSEHLPKPSKMKGFSILMFSHMLLPSLHQIR